MAALLWCVGVFSHPALALTVGQVERYVYANCAHHTQKVEENVRRLKGALDGFNSTAINKAFEVFVALTRKYAPDQLSAVHGYNIALAVHEVHLALVAMENNNSHKRKRNHKEFQDLVNELAPFKGFNTEYAMTHHLIHMNCSDKSGGDLDADEACQSLTQQYSPLNSFISALQLIAEDLPQSCAHKKIH